MKQHTDEIITNIGNRYYPLPDRPWKYFQQWNETLFLHWKCPVSTLRDFVPATLELDTFDGSAWISLVVFSVQKLRLNGFPQLPYISEFEEINLRTYVTKDGIQGIYMFSLETDKFLTVFMTRLFIGLPYIKSKIVRKQQDVKSENNTKKYILKVNYKGGEGIRKMPVDYWLTERHCLYEIIDAKTYRFDIHHVEWDLKQPTVKTEDLQYYAGKMNLAGVQPDLKHYAHIVKVLLWGRIRV